MRRLFAASLLRAALLAPPSLVLTGALPAALTAQVPGGTTMGTVVWTPGPTPPRLRSLPASTRALALGNAYMMNAGHADALFYHPALISGASGFGLDVQTWGGEASSATASAAFAWLGGGVAVGLQTLQASMPSVVLNEGQAVLLGRAGVPVSERLATLGYARRIVGFQVGAAGKLVDERVGEWSSTTVLVDVGVARALGPLTVGLTVQDFGNDPFEASGGVGPARVVLGAGTYGRRVGPLDVGLTAALTHDADHTWVGGGLEVGYWPIQGRTFIARVGVQDHPRDDQADPFTFGFAFWGDDLVLEWAMQGFGDLGERAHRFGVRWR